MGSDAGGNYVYGVKVENKVPCFDDVLMKNRYTVPQGACLSVELHAADAEGHRLVYMSMGKDVEALASLAPQESAVIDYRPRYSADIFYPDYFYSVMGTDVPALEPGSYGVSFLVYDYPEECTLASMMAAPFYCGYAVWDAVVEVVGGTPFTATLSPAKESYVAVESVVVKWGVNNVYFKPDSRLRITMSRDYGRSFEYLLADDVPALDGSAEVTLPDVSIGDVEVDFITSTRLMPGGVIRVEEIGGAAYALTALSPEQGGSFCITGGTGIYEVKGESGNGKGENGERKGESGEGNAVYDLLGREVYNPSGGVYIVNGKKFIVR